MIGTATAYATRPSRQQGSSSAACLVALIPVIAGLTRLQHGRGCIDEEEELLLGGLKLLHRTLLGRCNAGAAAGAVVRAGGPGRERCPRCVLVWRIHRRQLPERAAIRNRTSSSSKPSPNIASFHSSMLAGYSGANARPARQRARPQRAEVGSPALCATLADVTR